MNFRQALLPVLLTGLLATGCAATPSSSGGPGGAPATIIVSAYPLEFLAKQIAGDSATVTDLVPPGAEPHDLELTAAQLAAMSTADAVIYLSGFQPAVDEAIATVTPKLAIDANAGLTLLPALDTGEEDEHPAAGAHDPHVWQSPANMVTMAQTISAALSTARPDLAATFATNTAALVTSLNALDHAYSTGLSDCTRTQFITSHAAFAYLAERYHLTQIPIAGIDPTVEPTASRIAEVQKLAARYHVTTIFFETLVSSAVATSIAGDLGLKSAVLDPIEGITANSAGTNYLEVMESNLKALQEANGCR